MTRPSRKVTPIGHLVAPKWQIGMRGVTPHRSSHTAREAPQPLRQMQDTTAGGGPFVDVRGAPAGNVLNRSRWRPLPCATGLSTRQDPFVCASAG